jgi:hypothetical protein
MKTNKTFKTLLLLSAFIHGTTQLAGAMEKSYDSIDEEMRHNRSSSSNESLFSVQSIHQRTADCNALIEQGKQSLTELFSMGCFQECLKSCEEFLRHYKRYIRNDQLLPENKFAALNFLTVVPENLFDVWSKPQLLTTQEGQTRFQKFMFSHIEIQRFLVSEIDTFSADYLKKFNPEYLYYNTLISTMTVFINFSSTIKGTDNVKIFSDLATTCFEKLQGESQFKDRAAPLIQSINAQVKTLQAPQPRNLGRNGVLWLNKKEAERQIQHLEIVRQSQVFAKVYSPAADFQKIREMIKASTVQEMRDKNKDKFISEQHKSHQQLCDLESGVAKKLGLKESADSWTFDDYLSIYKELDKTITSAELKAEFYNFMAISLNSEDYTRSEFRIKVFAKMMGSSVENFESLPGVLKKSYALLRYFQGQPQLWESYVTEVKRKQREKKDKQNKKRLDNMKNNLDSMRKQEESRVVLEQSHKEASKSRSDTAAISEQISISMSSTSTAAISEQTSTFADEVQESLTSLTKRTAQGTLDKMDSKKQKKEEKNHDVAAPPTKTPPAAPSIARDTPPSQVEQNMSVPNSAAKFYQSLYSTSPKLTPEQATYLLGECGLTVTSGKGSHLKCSLNNGETIKNKSGEVVWHCPDIEGLMMIVPKWDGKDIPDYMVKNLRYILEKIGFKAN